MLLKLDLGSGPRENWYADGDKWLHLDCEKYEGVVQWQCPEERIPVEDRTVDEVFVGQLLVELGRPEYTVALAKEIDRVCCGGAVLKVHCYGERVRGGFEVWKEFFGWLQSNGWKFVKEVPVNRWEEEGVYTYLVEMRKGGKNDSSK